MAVGALLADQIGGFNGHSVVLIRGTSTVVTTFTTPSFVHTNGTNTWTWSGNWLNEDGTSRTITKIFVYRTSGASDYIDIDVDPDEAVPNNATANVSITFTLNG